VTSNTTKVPVRIKPFATGAVLGQTHGTGCADYRPVRARCISRTQRCRRLGDSCRMPRSSQTLPQPADGGVALAPVGRPLQTEQETT
jgi:hypothetical protein